MAALAVIVVSAALILYKERTDLAGAMNQLTVQAILAASTLAVLAILAMYKSWTTLVTEISPSLTSSDLSCVYFIGQMSKYVPGSIWPILTQSVIARRRGSSPSAVATASLINLALTVIVSLIVGAFLLPFAPAAALDAVGWMSVVLALMALLLLTRARRVITRLIERVTHRNLVHYRVSGRTLTTSGAWATLGATLFGTHLYVLVSSISHGGWRELALAVCAYNLAAAVGVLAVFAPAGIGVRETVLIVVLAPLMEVSSALAVALASRATLVAIDVLLGLIQVVGTRNESAPETHRHR